MRSTPIGIALLNDEREHVWKLNKEVNEGIVSQWAQVLASRLTNRDGSAPEIVTGAVMGGGLIYAIHEGNRGSSASPN